MTDQITDDDLLTLERAIFGEQVSNFMASDIGQYIVARSKDNAEEAMCKLRTADPENSGTIRELQNAIVAAESAVTWLQEAINDGLRARQLIEDRE